MPSSPCKKRSWNSAGAATNQIGGTTRGPQHRAEVTLVGPDGATTGTATCFLSIWEDNDVRHWRGFLAAIEPLSVATFGEQRLIFFPSGETVRVEITRLDGEGKIHAIFRGRNAPPRVGARPAPG